MTTLHRYLLLLFAAVLAAVLAGAPGGSPVKSRATGAPSTVRG